MTTRAAAAVVIVLGLALLAGCGGGAEQASEPDGSAPVAAAAGSQQPSFLFVAQAQSGTLTAESGDAYTLSLDGLGPAVVAFSDRPARITRTVAADAFFGADWGPLFTDDPPNAALELLDEQGSATVAVFELSNPRLSGSSLTLDAVLLEEASGGLAHYTGRLEQPPARFTTASLFIDSAGESVSPPESEYCIGTGWLQVHVKTLGCDVAYKVLSRVLIQDVSTRHWECPPDGTYEVSAVEYDPLILSFYPSWDVRSLDDPPPAGCVLTSNSAIKGAAEIKVIP